MLTGSGASYSRLPFIPVKRRGGKNEEWQVYLAGQPLIGAHPTFADVDSTRTYIELLNEEIATGDFTLEGRMAESDTHRNVDANDQATGPAESDVHDVRDATDKPTYESDVHDSRSANDDPTGA